MMTCEFKMRTKKNVYRHTFTVRPQNLQNLFFFELINYFKNDIMSKKTTHDFMQRKITIILEITLSLCVGNILILFSYIFEILIYYLFF